MSFMTRSRSALTSPRHMPRLSRRLLPPLTIGIVALGVWFGLDTRPYAAEHAHIELALPAEGESELGLGPDAAAEATNAPEYQEVSVRRGDTVGAIFARLGIEADQLQGILALGKPTACLKRLHPGDHFRFRTDDTGAITELVFDSDPLHRLTVTAVNGGFSAQMVEQPQERRVSQAAGVITSSLFADASAAGLSDAMTLRLAKLFGWDIDFAQDLQEGDRFVVLYDEYYVDGQKLRDGEIIAAEFINAGKTYRALRYVRADGTADYYAPSGKTLRRALLRTPVDFTRITSGFSLRRRHPILNTLRAHKGVDYAAPTGTPVRAASDGRITFAGRKGGYGNTLILQSGKHYSTLYGHLSRFARGLRAGRTVKQGETIAYVGATGLATGPHLHYEFLVNGVHRNPLGVKQMDAEPLSGRELAAFRAKTQPLLAQLALIGRLMVASAQ
jgi:murein DD-endopeptidase MepM/ murein hydrolase activator NlpD